MCLYAEYSDLFVCLFVYFIPAAMDNNNMKPPAIPWPPPKQEPLPLVPIKRDHPKQQRKKITFLQCCKLISTMLCGNMTIPELLYQTGINSSILYKYKKHPIHWLTGKADKTKLTLVVQATHNSIVNFCLKLFVLVPMLILAWILVMLFLSMLENWGN